LVPEIRTALAEWSRIRDRREPHARWVLAVSSNQQPCSVTCFSIARCAALHLMEALFAVSRKSSCSEAVDVVGLLLSSRTACEYSRTARWYSSTSLAFSKQSTAIPYIAALPLCPFGKVA
jgi:hypothetical protein